MTRHERNTLICDLRAKGWQLEEISTEMSRLGAPISARQAGHIARKQGLKKFSGRVPTYQNRIPVPSRGVANPDKVFAERMADRKFENIPHSSPKVPRSSPSSTAGGYLSSSEAILMSQKPAGGW